MPSENITIKNIYDGYSDVVVSFLMEKYRKKVGGFMENQANHNRRDIDANSPDSKTACEPERETFTELKKRVENTASSKKQEPKQQENIPSCSAKNAENQAENLEEELEKIGMDKDKVEKLEEREPEQQENIPSCSTGNGAQKLEEELEKLGMDEDKIEKLEEQEPEQQENIPSFSTENAGNGAQKLGEELEKLEMEKNRIEKLEKEKARLKTVNGHSEKEIKKLQEELEKSQKSKAELEKITKDMISQLSTLTVNFQKQIQTPREDLETEKVENMELENESEMPEDDREDLKRKVELLMSENEEFRAQKLRMTEFEEGVARHTNSTYRHLQSALSNYPNLNSLNLAERDVLNLKLCLDEYRGNVAGYQPLAD